MIASLTTLMTMCAPLVHPTTLQALIEVESAGNPYAVSVNYPQGLRNAGVELPQFSQPRSARDALELTRWLSAQGYSTSVGLAQINVEHLSRWALHLADLFDPCVNLALAQRVLLDCDAAQATRGASSPQARLRRTLVCYNAGDSAAGARNPYAVNIARAAARRLNAQSRAMRGPA
jgi:type IV secretion system protein VirB1